MSDEAIAVTTSAKPRYTLEEYLAVVAALQQKANELQQEGARLPQGPATASCHTHAAAGVLGLMMHDQSVALNA